MHRNDFFIVFGIALIIIGNAIALIGIHNQFAKPGPYAWANVNPYLFALVFFIYIIGWALGIMSIFHGISPNTNRDH